MDPDQSLATRKAELDVSRIFLAYLTCGGDVQRTAHVAGCRLDDVLFLAREELWDKKMNDVGIPRGKKPDEQLTYLREINRMTAYIQASRLRSMIDLTIKWCFEDGEHRIVDFNQEMDKKGDTFLSTKPMLDLAKAAAEVHGLIYRALGDTVEKGDPTVSISNLKNLHLTVVESMAGGAGIPETVLKEADPEATKTNTKVGAYLDLPPA